MIGLIDVELTSWEGFVLAVFAVGLVVLFLFGTTVFTVLLGAVALALVLAAGYYTIVRIDKRARGERRSGGSGRSRRSGGDNGR